MTDKEIVQALHICGEGQKMGVHGVAVPRHPLDAAAGRAEGW